MTKDAHSAVDALAKVDLEPTSNRLAVLDVFWENATALTAADVFEAVLESHKMNRVTLYRILDLLEEKGVLNRTSSGERAARYCLERTGWPKGHSHIHCTKCGEVRCIDNEQLHFDASALSGAVGWRVDHVELRLDGVCPDCSKG